jgi:hypothetical protein
MVATRPSTKIKAIRILVLKLFSLLPKFTYIFIFCTISEQFELTVSLQLSVENIFRKNVDQRNKKCAKFTKNSWI